MAGPEEVSSVVEGIFSIFGMGTYIISRPYLPDVFFDAKINEETERGKLKLGVDFFSEAHLSMLELFLLFDRAWPS